MRIMMRTIFLFVVLGVLSSCEKFLDVNKNPNAPEAPPIDGLLTRVTQNVALNVFRVSNTTSYYVQYLASSNTASPTDVYEPVDLRDTWTSLYDNMSDIYDLDRMAAEQGATQYQGVAKVLMAMDLSLVHNLWGDAPFSEAFTGEDLTPAYDNAQTLFQNILGMLDQGIDLLEAQGSTRTIPTSSGTALTDLIHNGSTEAWIKTAHALKARLLNQLSGTPQYNPQAIFDELAQAYTSTADDAYITTFNVRNPWNQVAVDNAGLLLNGWLSEQYVEAMDGTTYGVFDPRLPLTASETRNGDYVGTPNGRGRTGTGTTKDESYISLDGYYSSEESPLYLITYEELKFIEAEAAFRSGDKTRAYAAYLEGIRANMDKMGVAPSARDAYINSPQVSVGAANLTLEDIFREKYKALFLMPVTWDDARRFDYAYEDFTLPENVATDEFVRRVVYPSVETSRNAENAPDVTDVTARLWWDQ